MNTRPPVSTTPGGSSNPPPVRRTAHRPSLYLTILSLAIAAIAATWLPFSVLYINALSQRPVTTHSVTTTQLPTHASHGQSVSPTPVTTRVS